jgi:hypothetical protein
MINRLIDEVLEGEARKGGTTVPRVTELVIREAEKRGGLKTFGVTRGDLEPLIVARLERPLFPPH